MDYSHILKKAIGGRFGGRRSVGKPRGGWKGGVWNDAIVSFQIRNWKAAERKKEYWRKEIGEAAAQIREKAP
jgi:hypothetical protein